MSPVFNLGKSSNHLPCVGKCWDSFISCSSKTSRFEMESTTAPFPSGFTLMFPFSWVMFWLLFGSIFSFNFAAVMLPLAWPFDLELCSILLPLACKGFASSSFCGVTLEAPQPIAVALVALYQSLKSIELLVSLILQSCILCPAGGCKAIQFALKGFPSNIDHQSVLIDHRIKLRSKFQAFLYARTRH